MQELGIGQQLVRRDRLPSVYRKVDLMRVRITSRMAHLADVDFVLELTRKMAEADHFAPHLASLSGMFAFRGQLLATIVKRQFPYPLDRTARVVPRRDGQLEFSGNLTFLPARADLVLLNGEPAGFQLWFEISGKQAHLVEYYLLAVEDAPQVRRHGCARHLVETALCTMPKSATIVGRCRRASHVMFDYLQRLGFVVDEETRGKEVRSISLPPEKRAAALAELRGACTST